MSYLTESEPEIAASSRGSSQRWFVFYAVMAALLVRLALIPLVYQGFLDPGRDHWEFGFESGRVAKSIVTGHGFGNPYWTETGPTALVTPVYPYLLAAIFWLFGVATKAAAIAMLTMNSFFAALTCIPVFLVTRRMAGLRTAKLAVWLWALFPYSIYLSADSSWYHSLLALFVATLLLWSLRLEESGSAWPWLGFGVVYGVSCLTNPVTLSVLPVLLGWSCYRRWRKGKSFALPCATAIAGLCLVLAPWAIRNFRAFGHPVFLKDNFWMEVCIGNLGDSRHWWNGDVHPAGLDGKEARVFAELGEEGYMVRERQQAIAFLREYPGTFLLRSARRAVYYWTGFWSLGREYLKEEPMDPWNIGFSSAYFVALCLGLRQLWRDHRDFAVLFGLVLLLFPAVYYFTHPEIAYRLPIDPLGVMLVSYWVMSKLDAGDSDRVSVSLPQHPWKH